MEMKREVVKSTVHKIANRHESLEMWQGSQNR